MGELKPRMVHELLLLSTMKLITAVLLSLAVSTHASQIILNNVEEDENVLKMIAYEAEHPAEHSGFSLNLDHDRLVQFDPEGSPVVLTEREKVSHLAEVGSV